MSSTTSQASRPIFDRYAASHQDPQGPGDARPTSEQIIKDEQAEGKLKGKIILVTGGSSGLGIDTARVLASTGAKIVLAVRDVPKAEKVVEGFVSEVEKPDKSQFDILQVDLESLESVRKAAADFLARYDRLDILINNAGVGGVSKGKMKDGFETHFGVNHLSHFLLFELLKPILLKSSTPEHNSRVIALSSSIHHFGSVKLDDYNWESTPYDPAGAYASSKTANIWFANELERRYGAQGLHAISVHPGGIETGLGRFHAPEFVEMMSDVFKQYPDLGKIFKTPSQGAATTVLAAIGRGFEGKGGFYMEDCSVPRELLPTDLIYKPGYSPWVYDEAGEKKLWEDSLAFVGLSK